MGEVVLTVTASSDVADSSSSIDQGHGGASPCGSSPAAKRPRGLLVCFQDLSYSIPVRRAKLTLLHGVTGFFEPGQVAAVMGPSGSGKTTFLDVLAGRKTSGSMGGTVLYGGLPASRSLLRRATGYVEQFDTLVDTLTVSEMLLYTAQLKRPRSEPLASKTAAVEALLGKLGLAGCGATQIGGALKRGISGGQAKRLNIGIALITDPRVLFLDEPTSGLDSFTANEVMSVVASLARDGTTIATTIHSPSSYTFGLFDRLLVLMGGRLVYLGGAGDAAIAYFTGSCGARQPRVGDNLAEWMLEAVTQADREGSVGVGVGSKDSSAAVAARASLAETYSSALAPQVQQQLDTLLRRERQKLGRNASRQELQQLSLTGPLPPRHELTDGSGPQQLDLSEGFAAGASSRQGSWLGRQLQRLRSDEAYVTPAWWGLKVLLQYRTWRNYMTPHYVLPRSGEKLLFAAVVLSLYYGKGADMSTMNVPVLSSLLFLMVLAPICAAVLYLPSMMMERALYIREHSDGLYRPLTYLVFKLLDELVICLPVTAATSAAVFFACKLQGSYVLFWLISFVTLANGSALSYFLASASPNMSVAMGVLPFLLCMALILCGFMIRGPAMPAYWSWAVKLNVAHYSWGALMINQYGHGSAAGFGGMGVLSYFGLAEADAWSYLAIVVAFFFGWSVLAWLALAFVYSHKR